MHLPSSIKLRDILQSTLYLVDHYGKDVNRSETQPILAELRITVQTAIAALEKDAAEEAIPASQKEN